MTRWPTELLGELIEERTERLGKSTTTVYSVTNENGFVRSLDLFDKRVFSTDIGNYKRVRYNDLAYNPSRINVGSIAICENKEGGAVSPMYIIVRSKQGLLSRYLLYFLKSETGLEQIRHRCEGAVRFQLKFRDLCAIPILVPPLLEQERIVNLLNEADELRKLRARTDERTAELIPALFCEMFGNPEHTRFPVKRLFELIAEERPITYGILKPGPNINGGIPYVRVTDIKQNRLRIQQLMKTTREIANPYRRSMLCPGDILITIRGTVGRTCIVPEELRGANITQDTARLALIPGVELKYAIEFLNTPWSQSWMRNHTIGQAVKGLNLGDLRNLPIPIPPMSLQTNFSKHVTEVRELENRQSASRLRLEALFQSLLHHAFGGDL